MKRPVSFGPLSLMRQTCNVSKCGNYGLYSAAVNSLVTQTWAIGLTGGARKRGGNSFILNYSHEVLEGTLLWQRSALWIARWHSTLDSGGRVIPGLSGMRRNRGIQ